ncbi:MAG: DEAD/DEAH box helicase [Armatimonadetes bacterium]|nr:DEAD/DEAH box helicase [Armatimonadota bacterium]
MNSPRPIEGVPFSAPTLRWFQRSFAEPTPVQERGWPAIAAGRNALLLAPTGSGKTLAAFLWSIDRVLCLPADSPPGVRVLYISPLKALVYDVERNLRAPLAGIQTLAEEELRTVRVSMRTGDTPQRERRLQARDPADILVTTPESLYLLLGSAARQTLKTVETVIVDEIHALAGTKRGVHLALSLERLACLTGSEPQRIGLSATVRPAEEVAAFLGGDRPVEIVDASSAPRVEIEIVVPVPDMENPERVPGDAGGSILGQLMTQEIGSEASTSIWPSIYPRLLDLIRSHRSTILFTNSRGLCERLALRLNELAGEELALAHHGSVAHERREAIESSLKAGRLKAIVATSSLELGIDMGAVDLVVLVESPGSVARGLQRIGRAGHQVGEVSRGKLFPKFRGDLLECAVVVRRMVSGEIESLRVPCNAIDVLAQQVVAMCSVEPWRLADLELLIRRTYSFRELSREVLAGLLDMLSGRYPSTEFAELSPRIHWDREQDLLQGRRGARTLALVNAGTIPDRGLYGVYLGEDGPRVGELDEEMVHEVRAGQNFLLGASTWKIQEITRDRVIVAPAPGEPGRMPFWRGDGPGRPVELGRAVGAFVRELGGRLGHDAQAWLQREYALDSLAAANLTAYVREQQEATRTLPTDRAITVERFRDELGDWRICILSPFGSRVHAPWAMALEAKLSELSGFEVQTLWSDDGIVLRLADTDELPELPALVPDPDEVEDLVVEQLGHTALFAGFFRENAARALLLPRRLPGKRTPLWAQRLRAQSLLAVARTYPSFPIVLETYRQALQDVFDLPSLIELLRAVQRREIRVDEVETESASPFSRSLVFAYVAAYLYEGDTPLAERRAQALTLDKGMLRELLGHEELRELLDASVVDALEAEMQHLSPERAARHPDALSDILRRLGDLELAEIEARCDGDPRPWLEKLERDRRIVSMRIGGRARWVVVEDAALYRDGLGAVPPGGLPAALLEPAEEPLENLLLRYSRTHGPFTTRDLARRYQLAPGQLEPALRALLQRKKLLFGDFRPGGSEREWCDPEVLRRLRQRTLARLRSQVAPVESAVLARFLVRWHGIGEKRGGSARLEQLLLQLEGLPLSFRDLEHAILPSRLADYQPRHLDELGQMGLWVWIGCGALGTRDGRIALYRRDRVALLRGPSEPLEKLEPRHVELLERLERLGASFFFDLCPAGADREEVLGTLWDLVWSGLITNDGFQPLRALGPGPRRPRATPLGAGGRWVPVSQILRERPEDTRRAYAWAQVLLERYGVVSRDVLDGEDRIGGFSPLYSVYRAMEESGKVRRGYFVEGLTGAQFAWSGTVDRLRAARETTGEAEVLVLAATDPANPYGALLPWPGSDGGPRGAGPRRAAGARVVMVDGEPVFFLDRGRRKLLSLPAAADRRNARLAAAALESVARGARGKALRLQEIDGEPARKSPLAPVLEEAGFQGDFTGLMLLTR